VVEQPRDQEARPGRDLGDDRVGGGLLDGAGAPGVPELQVGQLGEAPRDQTAAFGQL
jgi:hypothetical protein